MLYACGTIFILLVNFYDISKWQERYLEIWSYHMEHPYILASDFFKDLGLRYSPIYQNYLAIHGTK